MKSALLPPPIHMNFRYLEKEQQILDLIEWHNRNSEFVVIDTETTSKDAREARLIDIQMSGKTEDSAVAFDGKFLPLLLQLKSRQVYWNFKYDWKVAYHHGVDLRDCPMHDAMLLDHLDDENREHNLDSHVQEKWGDKYKEEFWSKYGSYLEAPPEVRLDYGCRDIVYTGRVYRMLRDSLRRQSIPDTLVDSVHDLARGLFDTELLGVGIDLNYTIQMGSELKSDIVKTKAKLRELGGADCEILELEAWDREMKKAWTPTGKKWLNLPKPEFNFGSSSQLKELLYGRLKLPAQFEYNKKTKQRSLTANDKALEELEHLHPLIPELRRLRKFSTMYGTFIEGALERSVDSRIYPEFNVNGAKTGRISHSNPNMGNIPSKGEWTKIRGIYVPDPGHKLITCDYGQLEVCVEAHFSLDKNLLRIINEGASKHDITSDALGIPRPTAKTLNFAMQYWCTAKKVAAILGVSLKEGEAIYAKYWETYGGVRKVFEECRAKVDRGEPIVNPFGRHRRLVATGTKWEKEAVYRQAYSSLIQGTGSDITSVAFGRAAKIVKERGWGRPWFTVHDELLILAKDEHVAEVQELLKSVMVQAGRDIGLRVPLSVDCSPPLDRWLK